MKPPPLKPAEMELVRSVFRLHPEIETATLFGSRAKGTHSDRSDVDLVVTGNIEPLRAEGIAADSLAPRQVGQLMFPLAKAHVERSVLVSDDDIRAAQRALWETLRVVAEPGGAAAMAALLSGRYRPDPDERVAVLLCGANTTAVDFG